MAAEDINHARLKAIAEQSPTAEIIMADLAMRERQRGFSDIVRQKARLLRQGEKIVDADANRFWQLMEAEGMGAIVYGRKNKLDRFEWSFSLKDVAKAALDGKAVPKDGPVQKIPSIVEQARQRAKDRDAEMMALKNSRAEKKAAPKLDVMDEAKKIVVETKTRPAVKQAPLEASGPNTRIVVVPLRNNFDMRIELPIDLNAGDLEFIQSVLKRSIS